MTHSPLAIEDIHTVAVLGAGTMGNGIAHVFALAGYNVILRDIDERLLAQAVATISANLDREIKKGKVAESEKPHILARITLATGPAGIAKADFVVEAVPERLELKQAVLAEANGVLRPEAILATNTSSIGVTALAAASGRPDRFIGMHFMNPVPVMSLVEIIRALQTSDATVDSTMRLCEKLGKQPILVKDSPGFVSNRVLMPLINEAVYCVMEGVATAESVDAVMKMGMSHPMGPLELADLIGLDVCLSVLDVLYDDLRDPKFTACPLLRTMVRAGRLGKKSGRGFYAYESTKS